MAVYEDREFSLAIASLTRSAPTDWERFLAAYRVYNAGLLKQLIASPVDQLQVAQGRAKNGDELLRIFEGARLAAEQITKGRNQ